MRFWLIGFLMCVPLTAAERAGYDSNGRIISLLSENEDLDLVTNITAVLPNGKRVPLQMRREGRGAMRDADDLAWTVPFQLADGGRGHMRLKSEEGIASVVYSVSVTPETPLDISAIEFTVDLPRNIFVGGQIAAEGSAAVPLTAVKPAKAAIFDGESSAVRLQDAGGAVAVDLSFDQTLPLTVVDRWDPSGRFYQVRAAFQKGPAGPNAAANLSATLRLTSKPAAAPVKLTLDSAAPGFHFDGFGANYCWNNLSPAARYTIANLKLAWARSEMKLVQWDKERSDPGPELRADFEMMRRFQQMGVPYVVSIWWLPERLYTDAYEKPRSAHFRIIKPEKWGEFLELLGSYWNMRSASTTSNRICFPSTKQISVCMSGRLPKHTRKR
jgi:hypothetical protein